MFRPQQYSSSAALTAHAWNVSSETIASRHQCSAPLPAKVLAVDPRSPSPRLPEPLPPQQNSEPASADGAAAILSRPRTSSSLRPCPPASRLRSCTSTVCPSSRLEALFLPQQNSRARRANTAGVTVPGADGRPIAGAARANRHVRVDARMQIGQSDVALEVAAPAVERAVLERDTDRIGLRVSSATLPLSATGSGTAGRRRCPLPQLAESIAGAEAPHAAVLLSAQV